MRLVQAIFRSSIFHSLRISKRVTIYRCSFNEVYQKRSISMDYTRPIPVIKGSCKCGSVGWEGKGQSAINFTCHCSICRSASGRPNLTACGFKSTQVEWINEESIEKTLPPNSKNYRLYCKSCKDYIGEDATRVLGVIGLPLHLSKFVDDCYKPNHHIFYKYRSQDVEDSLPKWEELPDGPIIPDKNHQNSMVMDKDISPEVNYSSGTGRYRKDVLPLSPTRPPYPSVYHFTEHDPIPNHVSYISPEKLTERIERKYYPSPDKFVVPNKKKRDVIIIGGGHNGLVAAAYLAKSGLDVAVLERRHLIGGAAVTEEIVPGFKFSRASYLAGLFRPQIIKDLELEKYGFEYIPRNPSSFTPSKMDGPYGGKYLMFWDDPNKTWDSVAQFSKKDADALPEYEKFLGKVREVMEPLLDGPPPDISFRVGKKREKKQNRSQIWKLVKLGWNNKEILIPFYELFTGPASQILDRWFDSEILKTTLATDAVIGALCSPTHNGSAYILLHHVMGEAAGKKGVWSYVRGGMGALSNSIAASAKSYGSEIITNAFVKKILYDKNSEGKYKARGILMSDGTELTSKVVLSNATPYHTFLELLPGLSRDSGNVNEESPLPPDFQHHIRYADYSCGALKINCAVDALPNFICCPNDSSGKPGPQHHGTIHFENFMEEIENAAREASIGIPATRPVLEMTIPSALDNTLAPPGKHVVQLFVQFAPYHVDPKLGSWTDPKFKEAFADRCFSIIDEFAPGFSKSVIARDILSPLDLERIIGLHKGNIMHGALGIHQLAYARPIWGYDRYRTPLEGLYLCGSGAHPGGGVMGAAGRNCANQVISDLER